MILLSRAVNLIAGLNAEECKIKFIIVFSQGTAHCCFLSQRAHSFPHFLSSHWAVVPSLFVSPLQCLFLLFLLYIYTCTCTLHHVTKNNIISLGLSFPWPSCTLVRKHAYTNGTAPSAACRVPLIAFHPSLLRLPSGAKAYSANVFVAFLIYQQLC